MVSLLMGLGFTESKVDPNLYFKVEGERPVMLMLYVNDLFLTGENKLIEDEILKRITSSQMGATRNFEKVQNRGSWYPVTLDGYIEY